MTEISAIAFSARQVRNLTGLSVRQLGYWDATGFFSPEYAEDYGYGSFSRVYSFRDLVGLYVLSLLRKRYKFSLQELRPVGEYLHRFHETPWSGLALHVLGRGKGKQIIFRDPEMPDTFLSTRPVGQTIMPFLVSFEAVATHVERRLVRFRTRRSSQVGRISRNRFVIRNAPALEGTRIPTAAVWHFHVAGYSVDDILKEYPRLRPDDVGAAIDFEFEKRRELKAG